MSVPSPLEQIEFLQKVQRLLSEGQFVASYKFALLRALADLAVLKGDDSGVELELKATEIAEVFVELYWRQTKPFCGPGDPAGRVGSHQLQQRPCSPSKSTASLANLITQNTADLIPVNANGVFPEPFEDDSAAPSMMHTPFLAEKLGVFFGKLDTVNGDASNFAYSNEQFIDRAFGIIPVVIALAIRWGQPRAQIA